MITIKNNTLERISTWSDETIHILADFDRTLTVGGSDSSWSILSKSKDVPKEYASDRQKLYDYYRHIEIDETLDFNIKNKLMVEWWIKHIELFVKYQVSESVINDAATNLNVLALRKGVVEFLKSMKNRGIPIIIISAGIGNFIEQILIKNNCNFDNIHIVSNFIKFDKGIAVGMAENIIHSLNKDEVSLTEDIKSLIENRPNIILLGDSASDTLMAPIDKRSNALKIGFLEERVEENRLVYEEKYDVVATDNCTYTELSNTLEILK